VSEILKTTVAYNKFLSARADPVISSDRCTRCQVVQLLSVLDAREYELRSC